MRKMKRVLAVLLVLVMAMSTLAACGKTEQGSTTTTTNKTETSDKTENAGETTTETDEWTWPLAETKTVSLWTWWANDYFTDPKELKGIQAIEKNTNVHVDWVWVTQQ